MSEKGEIGNLRKQLQQARIGTLEDRREVLRTVISRMSMRVQVSSLFPDVVMLCNTTDVVQKKMTYLFIITYAYEHPDLTLLVVNTLQNDCNSDNPTIRGLALRCLSTLVFPNIVEYVVPMIKRGVEDKSAYVRKISVVSILKLYHVMQKKSIADKVLLTEGGMVDKLYSMLRDSDPYVISNAIHVLDEILCNEGGIAVSRKLMNYLLRRLEEFDEWGRARVIALLNKLKPEGEEEIFDLMNILDDYLARLNPTLLLGTASAFLNLTEDMPEIRTQVYERIIPPMLTVASNEDATTCYAILKQVRIIAPNARHVLAEEYVNFFLNHDDEGFNQLLKLEILAIIANEHNVGEIVEEIASYIFEFQDIRVSRTVVSTLGDIALRIPEENRMIVVRKFLDLIELEAGTELNDAIVPILERILRANAKKEYVELIVPAIQQSAEALEDPMAQRSLVWVLGEFGEHIWESPYILEGYVDDWEGLKPPVKLALLTAVFKLFFKRSPECEAMLLQMFKKALESDEINQDVHDKALLYFRMLAADSTKAESFLSVESLSEPITFAGSAAVSSSASHPTFNKISCTLSLSSSEFASKVSLAVIDLNGEASIKGERPRVIRTPPPTPPRRKERNMDPQNQNTFSRSDSSVVEVDLLGTGLVSSNRPEEVAESPEYMLVETQLDSKKFQTLWAEYKSTEREDFSVRNSVDLKDASVVERILRSGKVNTIASGKVKGNIKMFCYSKEPMGGILICEVFINCNTREARITMKMEEGADLSVPCKHISSLLREESS